LTSGALLGRLAGRGIDLGELEDRFVRAEDLGRRIGTLRKLKAVAASRLSWSALHCVRPAEPAVILFTSGSESLPKAVPLSHANILANMRDLCAHATLLRTDRMVGMLPPFHSFGLTVTVLLPLCVGIPAVYHADPTEAGMLARLIEAYKVTVVVGTPTFLHGIVRVADPQKLASLRLAVTGAEKCPDRVYEALARQCPQLTVLEGYGVTECSPVISVNDESAPVPGSIGKVLPSLDHALVDPETGERVAPGRQGMLLVRGPSVFGGYLHYDGAPPFVSFEGADWYRTGDLVSSDEAGVLSFRGRLKRFAKVGGEMISLPAIEGILEAQYGSDEGPVLAVEATPDEDHPEIVLFATFDVDRAEANRQIREAGLSGLHSIRRVVRLDEIPLLGTGKTDYRALRRLLGEQQK
jgi:acyl-[acyl-carrier-protein]-phospholipid O-acyltransferase/long-chain-fatty-acid--[acyl-carrier-protein] ligase